MNNCTKALNQMPCVSGVGVRVRRDGTDIDWKVVSLDSLRNIGGALGMEGGQ